MLKIGLVDIDGHVKAKGQNKITYPNLALMKLSAYHKAQGDEVEWALHMCHYDRVYIAKVFNFTPDDDTFYNADEVIRGGTGYNIKSTLPDFIDSLQPDYSIYPNIPFDTAYGFLTRGCPNKCPWCVVPTKEGKIRPYMDVDDIAINGRTKLILMDNNILAGGEYAMLQLQKIIDRGYQIDFNQALDARLVSDEFAYLLANIRWINRRIRFGCDTHTQIAECERAINLINHHGYKGDYFLYTMIGGKSDFYESYARTHYWWLRNRECRNHHLPNIYPYSQPYRDPFKPNQTIPQWQKDMARWCNKKELFQLCEFKDYEPRKGFKCNEYFKI